MSTLSLIFTVFIFALLSNIIAIVARILLELARMPDTFAKPLGLIIGYAIMSGIVLFGVCICGWKLL